jgi:hypothetical protein
VACARKDDAATREVRSKVKSGATTANGAPHALTASYVYYRNMFETDPNTSAAWTPGGVDGILIGPEVGTLDGREPRHLPGPRDSGQSARVSALAAEVLATASSNARLIALEALVSVGRRRACPLHPARSP